jgi:hypothetical protein
MDFSIASQRALVFGSRITPDDAKSLAWSKKIDAFGTVDKLGSFLSRPKDEDFELLYEEMRYQPFWHIVAHAHYVYDRTTHHHWPVSGPEVKSITLSGVDYQVTDKHVILDVLEHSEQTLHEEVYMEGLSGQKTDTLKPYLDFSAQEVTGDISSTIAPTAIIVPPKARASAIVRETLAKTITGIQADKIFEETIELKNIDLYYRPVYAYQYKWLTKAKEAIVEIDGLTGKISFGQKTFKEYLGKSLDRDFLFDLGADVAGSLVPGGSIAVKLVKKAMDSHH